MRGIVRERKREGERDGQTGSKREIETETGSKREKEQVTETVQLQPFVDQSHLSPCPLHPLQILLCPPVPMSSPALLWRASDMQGREDGRYEYVPTQLFQPGAVSGTEHPLARRRVQLMSSTSHTNTVVGNVYVGNCVEPMDWAGGNVGYIIDASNGTSNVRLCHTLSTPLHMWSLVHCPMDQNPHVEHRVRWGVLCPLIPRGVSYSEELCVECSLCAAVAVPQLGSAA